MFSSSYTTAICQRLQSSLLLNDTSYYLTIYGYYIFICCGFHLSFMLQQLIANSNRDFLVLEKINAP